MPTTEREFDLEWLHDYFETHTVQDHAPNSHDCIFMTLKPSSGGYVQLTYGPNGGTYSATRLSFILHHRLAYLPDAFDILHRCDNPPCVNPMHLYAGTALDNALDRENKGRGKRTHGTRSHFAVLTEEQVHEIRNRYKPNARPGSKNNTVGLAIEFGVTKSTINRIILGKKWAHLD